MKEYILVFIVAVLAALVIGYYYAVLPARKGFRVLMYHHIKPGINNGLCVSTEFFTEQLAYLKQNNYYIISGSEFKTHLKNKSKLPNKSVLITFDDAYYNFYEFALPILNQYQMPAVVFVPTSYLGGVNQWDQGSEPIMEVETLKNLPQNMELAIHCHQHINYGKSMLNNVEDDLIKAKEILQDLSPNFLPFLAYPYGSFPRRGKTFKLLKSIMKHQKIKGAFRIGNKVNPLRIKPKYLIKRLDIRGDENFLSFKRKFKYGKI